MLYGWVGTTGQIELDYHQAGDKYLALLRNDTIEIPEVRTFRFDGYRTSILRFLQRYPMYKIQSAGDTLYMRMGELVDASEPAKIVGDRAAGAFMPDVQTIGTTAMNVAGSLARAASGRVKNPDTGTIKERLLVRAADHMFNKPIRVNLDSLTRPRLNKFDKLQALPKVVTFQQLAAHIHKF